MYKGQRVELHPATDEWMQGDRYGVVVGFGRKRQYCTGGWTTGVRQQHTVSTPVCEYCTFVRPIRVKLDKSGRVRRFHPDNVMEVAP